MLLVLIIEAYKARMVRPAVEDKHFVDGHVLRELLVEIEDMLQELQSRRRDA